MYEIVILINHLFLFLATISLFLYFKDKSGSKLKGLSYFYAFNLVIAITSSILSRNNIHNVWLIVNYINIEFLYFFILYFSLLKKNKYKKFAMVSVIVYESAFIWEYFIQFKSSLDFPVFAFGLGRILIIVVIFLFLLEIMSSDVILHIQKFMVFWLSIGLLFYYVVPLPGSLALKLFIDGKYPVSVFKYSNLIQLFSNFVLYSIIILSTRWTSMTYK